MHLVNKPHKWELVRFWLADVADELVAFEADCDLPSTLALDRVWITRAGTVKLLDFQAPGVDRSGDPAVSIPAHVPTPSLLIKQIAMSALQGRVVAPDEAAKRDIDVPIPLKAKDVLDSLNGSRNQKLPTADLRLLTDSSTTVSTGNRLGALSLCLIVFALGATILISEYKFQLKHRRLHPEIGQIGALATYYRVLVENQSEPVRKMFDDDLRVALEVVMVDRYRSSGVPISLFSESKNELLKSLQNSYGELTAEQLARSERILKPHEGDIRQIEDASMSHILNLGQLRGPFVFAQMSKGVIGFLFVPSCLGILLLGSPISYGMRGIAVVTPKGVPATRIRLLFRNIILWSSVIAWWAVFALVRPQIVGVVLGVGLIAMLVRKRGFHDQIAGTFLVPR